jgi:putative ABC transport system substrate-binding protein
MAVAAFVPASDTEAQQPGKTYRLGCLWAVPAPVTVPYRAALEAGLKDLGWIAGQNLVFEHRFPDTPADFPKLAASVVAARVDAIIAMTNPVVAAAASATSEIPIVGVYVTDPVGTGFAVSLARPGKNVTGLTMDPSPEVYGKQLELLKKMVPAARRVQVLRNPDWYGTLNSREYNAAVQKAARSLQLEIYFSDIRDASDIEQALRTSAQKPTDAIYAMPELVTFLHGPLIAQLATRQRLPVVFGFSEPVQAGGLASYGPSLVAMPRYAASLIDRLFRGARAGELPFEQPTKFELVINQKTAQALRLTVPRSLRISADHVLE